MQYPRLFSRGRIGSLILKNRGIMMPMATNLADKDGIATQRLIRYYQERARGGVAMIIHEYTGVDDVDSIPAIHNLRIARDYHIAPMEELVDAVHLYDCKIIAQCHIKSKFNRPTEYSAQCSAYRSRKACSTGNDLRGYQKGAG